MREMMKQYLSETITKLVQFYRRRLRRKKDTESENKLSYQSRNKRSKTKYQVYAGFSDLSRIKIRVRREEFPSYNYNSDHHFSIELKDDLARINDDRVVEDFTIFNIKYKPEFFLFDFFVTKKEMENMDNVILDFKVTNTEILYQCVLSITEVRSLSLTSLLTTKFIPFTSIRNLKGFEVYSDLYTEPDIEFRNVTQLCKKEEEFVRKRKTIVLQNMRNTLGLEQLSNDKHVPNIAIIGSGGGIRAVVGMCGAMTALKENGILDSTMYTAGVSGSAWYLMALFANDKQNNPKDLNDGIRKRLQKFRSIQYWKVVENWKMWKELLKSVPTSPQSFSITNTFGHMIRDLLNEKEEDYWSQQNSKLEDGYVALPLLAALHIRDEKTINDYHEWIEFSPYEVFIPKYGVAIAMKKFGDKMYGGYITDEFKEETIDYLQGLCGSAFTKGRDYIPQDDIWFMSWREIRNQSVSLFKIFDTMFIGRVPNILRGIPQLTPIDNEKVDKMDKRDITDVDMMLVDAGISFNSPYPTVLHPCRKVDVIISFDFSYRDADDEWPFKELEEAERWAKDKSIPFPDIFPSQLEKTKNEWKAGKRDEVYVFQGDKAPTIVHFVLLNKSFRKTGDVKNNFDIFPAYDTFKFRYSEKEFNLLNLLIQHNVRVNTAKIESCIRKVIDRKRKENQ